MAHRKNHFNESGGCECECRKCVKIEMTEKRSGGIQTSVMLQKVCVCKKCSQDCPADKSFSARFVPTAYPMN